MEKNYTVLVVVDGVKEWAQFYDNALDAVNCYNKFVDHGSSKQELIVTLIEPNGKFHTNIFTAPQSIGVK